MVTLGLSPLSMELIFSGGQKPGHRGKKHTALILLLLLLLRLLQQLLLLLLFISILTVRMRPTSMC